MPRVRGALGAGVTEVIAVGVATVVARERGQEGDPLLSALRDGPLGVDELARRMRVAPSSLTARVPGLMLNGAIATLPDGRLALR